jgi:hypothetical protein
VVQAKVGLSYVSTANAAANRAAENPGWDFGAVKAAAHDSWNAALSKIQVAGGSNGQQVTFYTALYHSLLHPNVESDVNGQYMGFDGNVHTVAPGHAEYANYSGWDIYRSEIQLVSMLFPRQASDIVGSMLDDYAQTGMLPKWNENDGESYVMVGDPADSIIADAYAFGATDFDAAQALSDMETEATVPGNIRPGLSYYEDDGYLPIDGSYGCCNYYGPVSTQEEYNVADNSIAELAAALHKTSVADEFATRANNWQNVYNPGSGFLQPKLQSGQFDPGFVPTSNTGFVEADAYIYAAEVPFDLRGLIAAEGGDANWISALNGLTANVSNMSSTEIQMGNEPSFDIPWEYDYAGAPYQTQAVVREIQDQLYTNAPGGLAGNDDLGAMSSWYVWSAIGGYPETPGSATVAIGSPMFRSIAIHLGDGKVITETAPSASDAAAFVHGLTLDGAPYSRAYLPASLFSDGGTLDWTLAAKPDQSWAAATADAPPSDTSGLLPALGYASVPGQPGASSLTLTQVPNLASSGTGTVNLGVQDTSGSAQQVTWTASVPSGSGLQVSPSSGSFTVAAGSQDDTAVQLQVPSDASSSQYTVTFRLTTAAGVTLPPVIVGVQVQTPYASLPAAYDNAGITDTGSTPPSGFVGFDGSGSTYSAQALAADGLTPGATVTVGGVPLTWPDAAAAEPDNVVASGQVISLAGTGTGTGTGSTLALAGAADNGAASGTATVVYSDGSTQTFPLTFNDWWLNAALPGTTVVATAQTASQSPHTVSVYGTTVQLDPGKTPAYLILPDVSSSPVGGVTTMHVFAAGIGG